jgi:hypothetical protein
MYSNMPTATVGKEHALWCFWLPAMVMRYLSGVVVQGWKWALWVHGHSAYVNTNTAHATWHAKWHGLYWCLHKMNDHASAYVNTNTACVTLCAKWHGLCGCLHKLNVHAKMFPCIWKSFACGGNCLLEKE